MQQPSDFIDKTNPTLERQFMVLNRLHGHDKMNYRGSYSLTALLIPTMALLCLSIIRRLLHFIS